MEHNGTELQAITYNGQEVNSWVHNGIEVFKSMIDYIYRTGSWLVPYTLSENWSEEDEYLYTSGQYSGKGSKTVGTVSFTLDVTNISEISVTFYMNISGSTNATPRGRLKLYSVTDTTITVASETKGTQTITLDVSTLEGEQTFKLVHSLGQDYEQAGYTYTAYTTVKVHNIDVA